MGIVLAYQLLTVASLPFYLKNELHARAIVPETVVAAKAASKDFRLGLAFACENRLEVAQGMICEKIQDNDLEDARARLTLRSAAHEAFVDGDYFWPADYGSPRVVSLSNVRSAQFKKHKTHEHYCPVVTRPMYSEFYIDHEMLCTNVSTRGPFPVPTPRAPSPFPGFFQSFKAMAGASIAWKLFFRK